MNINTAKKIILFHLLLINVMAFGMDKKQFFIHTNEFFHQNVENGLVKYAQIKSNDSKISDLVAFIGSVDLNTFSTEEKLAFYINAYNLLVIDQILAKYPIASPMNISGFFDGKKHLIAAKKMTLNNLENNHIRTYEDPRIHFALVCAALGCPKIGDFGFTPELLDTQLTRQTKIALNSPAFIIVNENKVKISEIFKWYRQDFGKSDKDLIAFINKFRVNLLPEKTNLSYYTYDWVLNDFSKQ